MVIVVFFFFYFLGKISFSLQKEEDFGKKNKQKRKIWTDFQLKKGNFWTDFQLYSIYIYAVKLKTGPSFALFKVKNWSIFCFFCFFIFENLILPAERRGFLKKKQAKKTTKKTQFLKSKTGPIMLRNILDNF